MRLRASYLCVLLLTGLLVAAGVRCTQAAGSIVEIRPRAGDGWLVVDVRATGLLDERTLSTVESGMPGSCLLRVLVRSNEGEIAVQRLVERSLRLDLWQNLYWLVEGDRAREYRSLAAADSAFASFGGLRLLPRVELSPTKRYRIEVELAVSPLGPRDRDRLSRYVSQSRGGDRQEFALDLGRLLSRFVGRGSSVRSTLRGESRPFVSGELRASAPKELP